MTQFLIHIKNSLFGLVAIGWGFFLLLYPELINEPTFELLLVTVAPGNLGAFFIVVGVLHVISRMPEIREIESGANIALAFVFLLAMLTNLYASFFALAWLAIAGICLNLVINAYLLMKDE